MSEVPGQDHKDDYVFVGLRPHHEFPITGESFDQLDSFIAGLNESLGITNPDDRLAYSASEGIWPGISIIRRAGPDGLRVLAVTKSVEVASVNYNIRNDAGTRSNKMQPAASLDVLGKFGLILFETDSLTDGHITGLTSELQGRSFVSKPITLSIYRAA
jgi:hypothetical protein